MAAKKQCKLQVSQEITNAKFKKFDVKIPNKITRKAIEESRRDIGVKRFKSVADLFKDTTYAKLIFSWGSANSLVR